MSTKRYVLVIDFELVTTIVVGKEPRIIAFRNGSRHAGTRGFFTTGIEAEQEAIEKSGGFGSRYKLDSVTGEENTAGVKRTEPKKSKSKGADEENAEAAKDNGNTAPPGKADEKDNEEHGRGESGAEAEKDSESEGSGSEDPDPEKGHEHDGADEEPALIHDKTVTNKNKAISFLQEKFGKAFTQTADIAAMKEEAHAVYSLVFDDWK